MSHRPEDHRLYCHCGALATRHVFYGSGCGNICQKHLSSMRRQGRHFTAGRVVLVGGWTRRGAP